MFTHCLHVICLKRRNTKKEQETKGRKWEEYTQKEEKSDSEEGETIY